MNQDSVILTQAEISQLNRFYARVYGFVGLGIALSALVAGYLLYFNSWHIYNVLVGSGGNFLTVLMLVEVGVVLFASHQAAKNSPLALPLFIVYALLNGYSLSFILAVYAQGTVFAAFVTASLLFFVMAVIGATIKKDLSGFGRAAMGALIGLIIASFVNIFLKSSGMDWMISIAGVVIFSGLIAYDNQKIRHVFEATNGQVGQGWVISLALGLYLDFINIFLYLLRLFGRKK